MLLAELNKLVASSSIALLNVAVGTVMSGVKPRTFASAGRSLRPTVSVAATRGARGSDGRRSRCSSSLDAADSDGVAEDGARGALEAMQASTHRGIRKVLAPAQQQLLSVRGLGRKYMHQLWHEHKIYSLDELASRVLAHESREAAAQHLRVSAGLPLPCAALRCAVLRCCPQQHIA